jgi:hypothetical protein
VILDFVFERGLLFITLSNIGAAPAYDISVTFDHRIPAVDGGSPVNELGLFQRLKFIPPQKRITSLVSSYSSYCTSGGPMELEVRVYFHDSRGRRHVNVIKHDLSAYRDIRHI